jgi:phosphatidylglycerol:prolipoprotein diacylglycerol transferase
MNEYGFFAAAGAITTILWLRRRTESMGVTENQFWSALWLMVLGAAIGAKGFFVVLGWEHYASGELRFWRDFGTGFVFFGGFVGALLVAAFFAWSQRLDFLRGADYFAVALPLGHAIGRVGCFAEGCCPGVPSHPVQLYESAGLFVIALGSHSLLKLIERQRLPRGLGFCAYVGGYGLLRLLLDPLRADGRPERFLGISHQQGIAMVLLLGALLAGWLLFQRDRNRQRFHSLSAQS